MLYLTWLIPVLEGFPRSQRFLLGDRLQTLGMDRVGLLLEATYTKAPLELLRQGARPGGGYPSARGGPMRLSDQWRCRPWPAVLPGPGIPSGSCGGRWPRRRCAGPGAPAG